MGNCGNCSGGCSGCSGCTGCGGAMELTQGEIDMILTLGRIPFLPVARNMGDDIPVYLEDSEKTAEEWSLILQCLEKRGLISLDYHMPLKGFAGKTYEGYPVRGSFALTERGHRVLELLEVQGID